MVILDWRSHSNFSHLIDDCEEIDQRFFAHRRIRGPGSESEERPIEPPVDRPINHS